MLLAAIERMANPLRQSESRRFRRLPEGISVHGNADRCREAVLAFIAGTAGGWSHVDLDVWFVESYRPATRGLARLGQGTRTVALDGAFELAIMDASDLVRRLLASCAGGPPPGFVAQVVDLGFVVGAQDENGAIGHVPIDDPAMSLVDRLASILAADYLTRPNDYRAVAVCEECGSVSFEWTACCEHAAAAHPRESALVRRDGAPASYASILPPPES